MRLRPSAILAVTLWGASFCLARAATPDPVSAQGDATAVAHAIFRAMDAQVMVQKAMQSSFDSQTMQMPRPGWADLFRQAVLTEMSRHMPDLEAMYGRSIAGHYTEAELHAGARFLNAPLGQRLLAIAKAKGTGSAAPDFTPQEAAEVRNISRDPALAGFMSKLGKGMEVPPSVTQDFIALVLPDIFIRFGEAAKDAEARHATIPPA